MSAPPSGDWFHPYRYADPELRDRTPFAGLALAALDLHAWRRRQNCRSIRCTTLQEPWTHAVQPGEVEEETVALVRVEILTRAGGDVVETRTLLTAGETAEEVRAALLNNQPRATQPQKEAA